ncbi:MAG: hypothetical protein IJ168_01455 [Eubacterium sp.]|nr:hypothetical protein [Eubacterium sp.]
MWNKNDYEEYAISILGFFYPNVTNMIKGEAPDYYNNTTGLEITRAITTKNGEVDAFCRKNLNKPLQVISKKQLKKMGFNGAPVSVDSNEILYAQRSLQNSCLYYYKEKESGNLVLCFYFGKLITNESTADDIMHAISEKLCKLNNHYRLFSRNDLCIIVQEQLNYCICQEEIIDDLISLFVSSIKELYNKPNWIYKFDNIFLLFLDNLFCIDSKTWEIKRDIITQEIINNISSQTKN